MSASTQPASLPARPDAPAGAGGAWLLPALLLAVFAVNFATMPRYLYSRDPYAWREEARSILLEGRLSVDEELAGALNSEPGQYFVQNPRNGAWYSKYGLANGLMSLPPLAAELLINGDLPPFSHDGILLLNLWNITLTLGICWLLYRISAFYTDRPATRVVFVLGALYATFLWNYLRAQSSEIWQVLFFLGFYYYFIRFHRRLTDPANSPAWWDGNLMAAWVFLGALVLSRVAYGLLLPIAVVPAAYAILRLPPEQRRAAVGHLWPGVMLPPLLILVLLGAVNTLKFGSPWLSGYHQWNPVGHGLSGDLLAGVSGFLFHKQFSILLHFPLLFVSLAGLPRFFRQRAFDTIAIYTVFIPYLLAIGAMPIWTGQWCYGPRHLLFVLPVLSLPAISFLDMLIDRWRHWPWRVAAAGIAAGFGYSLFLQLMVNHLDFFAYYEIHGPAIRFANERMWEYLRQRHYGSINWDLARHRNDPDALPVVAEMPPQFVPGYRELVRQTAERTNYYWFDEPRP